MHTKTLQILKNSDSILNNQVIHALTGPYNIDTGASTDLTQEMGRVGLVLNSEECPEEELQLEQNTEDVTDSQISDTILNSPVIQTLTTPYNTSRIFTEEEDIMEWNNTTQETNINVADVKDFFRSMIVDGIPRKKRKIWGEKLNLFLARKGTVILLTKSFYAYINFIKLGVVSLPVGLSAFLSF